jgi:hypothetical protein
MKIIPLLFIPLLLTGCTDIRRRLSPDLLAVHTGETVSFAAHTSQEDALIAAEAEDPLLLHKRALINIRRGDVERGRAYLAAMRSRLGEHGGGKESDWPRAEEAEWECRPGFLDSREYLALLERLLSALERDYHFGHVSFYQDVYLAACKRQRQYRKALEFQRRISERSVRIIG